jgi:uncharacterized membrane protein YqaE (UPF0057 family)
MKRLILSLFTMLFTASLSMAAVPTQVASLPTGDDKVNDRVEQIFRDNITAFLELTPRSYAEMTGEKLTLKETIKLKAAQKMVKNQLKKAAGEETFPKGAYIILVILGWGFIPLGILSDWKGNDWWVNLLLTFLCWIPGVIHGLSKMKNYYN